MTPQTWHMTQLGEPTTLVEVGRLALLRAHLETADTLLIRCYLADPPTSEYDWFDFEARATGDRLVLQAREPVSGSPLPGLEATSR